MTVKYHVNSETGRANMCRADKQQCPLKEPDGKPAEHFTDKAAAKAHGEKILAATHGATKTLKKTKTDLKTETKTHGAKRKPQPLNTPKGMTPTEAKRIQEEKFKLTDQQGQKVYGTLKQEAPAVKSIGTSDEIASKLLDNNIHINEKKELLISHLSNKENYEKVREDFKNAGYDADTSGYVQNLMRGEAGPNSVLRQAHKDAAEAQKRGADISVSDVLIYAEEATDEYYVAKDPYRFTDFSEKETVGNVDVDLDEAEDLPEDLKDDPDFVIEDEDEDENEETD